MLKYSLLFLHFENGSPWIEEDVRQSDESRRHLDVVDDYKGPTVDIHISS